MSIESIVADYLRQPAPTQQTPERGIEATDDPEQARRSAALEVAEGASVVLPGEAGSRFVQFAEDNDHEGETWNWWLQLDGNEAELDKLLQLLATAAREAESDLAYVLTDNVEPEAAVDLLVKYGSRGYYPQHTKVTGTLTCPDTVGDYGDELYKGRVVQHFEPSETPEQSAAIVEANLSRMGLTLGGFDNPSPASDQPGGSA